jgi:hypothetical protein
MTDLKTQKAKFSNSARITIFTRDFFHNNLYFCCCSNGEIYILG